MAGIGTEQPSTSGNLSICYHPSTFGMYTVSHCLQQMLAGGFGLVISLKWQVCLLFAIVAVVPLLSVRSLLPLSGDMAISTYDLPYKQ
jgi:hypothetical protein